MKLHHSSIYKFIREHNDRGYPVFAKVIHGTEERICEVFLTENLPGNFRSIIIDSDDLFDEQLIEQLHETDQLFDGCHEIRDIDFPEFETNEGRIQVSIGDFAYELQLLSLVPVEQMTLQWIEQLTQ